MRHLTTKSLLAGALALPALVAAQPDTLRKLADLRGIYVGAAVSSSNNTRTAAYDSTLARSFNGAVAENAMKHQPLTPSRDNYNWTTADNIAAFAEANGMKLRGHTLVWHSQTANWFNNLSGAAASRDTTLKIMKNHIDSLAGRYKGRIHEWDVLNEAIAQNGGTSPNYRTGGTSRWYDRVGGIDYADSAFKWAQQADSAALLFYNDFGAEGMNNKSTNVYDLVTGLKNRGAPIHGVGLQCHFTLNDHDTAAIGQNMRRLAALGFVISLTEIDIQTSNSTQNWETQKARYKGLMRLCLSIPACKSYYAWGVNDAQSWRGANATALLFTGTTTITPKPAYWGVVEALAEGSTQTSTPSMPWNVLAAPDSTGGSVAVAWNAPVTDGRSPITGYTVRALSDSTKTCSTTGARHCVISGLHPDSSYRFVVRATNAIGTSGMSPPSTAAAALPVSIARGAGAGSTLSAGRFTRDRAFVLPEALASQVERLTMTVSDVSGRVVWRGSARPAATGAREVAWDGSAQGARAPVGMYVARVRVQGVDGSAHEATRRYMMLRQD